MHFGEIGVRSHNDSSLQIKQRKARLVKSWERISNSSDHGGTQTDKELCELCVCFFFSPKGTTRFRGFQMGVFVRGGDLNNWGRARTGCNN